MEAIIVALIGAISLIIQKAMSNKQIKKLDTTEQIKKIIEDNELLKKSNLSLIRSQLVSKCEHYLKLGYLPEYARYCLEELHKNYKKLGGNHGIEVLVDKTYELPLTKKDNK